MQPGPQDQRESRNVAHPADLADDGDEDRRPWVLKGLEQVAGGLEEDAEGGDEDRVKVEACAALEG